MTIVTIGAIGAIETIETIETIGTIDSIVTIKNKKMLDKNIISSSGRDLGVMLSSIRKQKLSTK